MRALFFFVKKLPVVVFYIQVDIWVRSEYY